jgi:hypothetical protein
MLMLGQENPPRGVSNRRLSLDRFMEWRLALWDEAIVCGINGSVKQARQSATESTQWASSQAGWLDRDELPVDGLVAQPLGHL